MLPQSSEGVAPGLADGKEAPLLNSAVWPDCLRIVQLARAAAAVSSQRLSMRATRTSQHHSTGGLPDLRPPAQPALS
jgi:hypothetical protein